MNQREKMGFPKNTTKKEEMGETVFDPGFNYIGQFGPLLFLGGHCQTSGGQKK